MVRMTLDELDTFARTILAANGLGPDHVDAIAATVVAGERDGCASHGVYRLLDCVRTLRAGKARPDASPRIEEAAPALVRIDAQRGFSPLAFRLGMPVLVRKARAHGIAALAINHCVHFSALWPEAEALASCGLVAFAFTPSHAWVAPAGGREPLFGTNPIAFGWPRASGHPFVFDFATSVAARGEIELHRRAGQPVPPGWGLDADGLPTTDPAAILAGSMLAFGGHKGSALAAMVELIAGPLIGDLTSAESLAFDEGTGSSPFGGELIIAIDPRGFLGDAAGRHMQRAEALFESIIAQGARLPSQRRYAARAQSLAEGVAIPRALHAELLHLL